MQYIVHTKMKCLRALNSLPACACYSLIYPYLVFTGLSQPSLAKYSYLTIPVTSLELSRVIMPLFSEGTAVPISATSTWAGTCPSKPGRPYLPAIYSLTAPRIKAAVEVVKWSGAKTKLGPEIRQTKVLNIAGDRESGNGNWLWILTH